MLTAPARTLLTDWLPPSFSSHRRRPIQLAVRLSAFIRPISASVLAAANGLPSDAPASHGASPTHSHSRGNHLKRLTAALVPAWKGAICFCTMDGPLQPRCGRHPRCRLLRPYQAHGGVCAQRVVNFTDVCHSMLGAPSAMTPYILRHPPAS